LHRNRYFQQWFGWVVLQNIVIEGGYNIVYLFYYNIVLHVGAAKGIGNLKVITDGCEVGEKCATLGLSVKRISVFAAGIYPADSNASAVLGTSA